MLTKTDIITAVQLELRREVTPPRFDTPGNATIYRRHRNLAVKDATRMLAYLAEPTISATQILDALRDKYMAIVAFGSTVILHIDDDDSYTPKREYLHRTVDALGYAILLDFLLRNAGDPRAARKALREEFGSQMQQRRWK